MQHIDNILTKYSNNDASVYDNTTLTYKSLNKKSKTIGHYLTDLQYNNQPIGFYTNNNSFIYILGIWNCNCFPVPLSKTEPEEKLKYIIKDSGITLILTDTNDVTFLNDMCKVININNITIPHKYTKPLNSITNEHAYLIYTSGTTGLPNGVLINKDSLFNLITSAIKKLNIVEPINILTYTSIGFDASIWDTFISLLSGSKLYIATYKYCMSPPKMFKYINKNKINMVTTTPAYLNQMPQSPIDSLNILLVMGEMAQASNMNFWACNTNVYNGYGPTETTIGATIHKFSIDDSNNNVGIPFDNYDIYILDDELNITESGELYIGGIGVAVGYWNKPELTNKKFINTKYGRLYKTGDLAKYVNNEFHILGRKDNQLKINGIRIELEAIETLIMELDFIVNVCVIYNKQLIVYYKSVNNENYNDTIKSYLSKFLNSGVIPHVYIKVEHFDLTTNGKINKTKLLEINGNNNIILNNTVSHIQKILIEIYDELFVTKSNIDTNYFVIGGDSLKAHLVVSSLKKHKLKVSALDVLKHPVINDLCKHIHPIMPKNNDDNNETFMIPLNPLQNDLYVYQTMYPNNAAYNMTVIYEFSKNININKLIHTLQTLVNKYEVLRTIIKIVDNIPMQCHDERILDIKIETLSDGCIESCIDQPFIMENDYLCKFKIFVNKNNVILVIVKHNIIIDLYSESLINNCIQQIYNDDILNNYGYNYIDYINDTNKYYDLSTIKNFWINNLKDMPIVKLPNTTNAKSNTQFKNIHLPNLLQYAKQNKTTPYAVLISALNILLFRYTNSLDINIGTQIADRYDENNINIVGFMVSTLMLRNKFEHDMNIETFIKNVSRSIYEIMSNKYITYNELVKISGIKVDVMFVLQNIVSSSLDLKDVETKITYVDNNNTSFPIYFEVLPNGDNYMFKVKHTNVYSDILIKQLLESFEIIINDMMINNDKLIKDIEYLHEDPIIVNPYTNATLTNLISKQSNNFPNKIAIKYCNNNTTYDEFNKESNKLARYLIDTYGDLDGEVIGVSMQRSKNFVIVLLGIMKTGACYVPINPDYPTDKINTIIDDCKPILVFTDAMFVMSFGMFVNLDDNDINLSKPSSKAYIIYTSGTTGKPKAIMITHQSILAVLNYFRMELDISKHDKVFNLTNLTFDIMVLEIFLPLVSGCQLIICPQYIVNNTDELVAMINLEQPTILQATPTQYSMIIDMLNVNNNMNILIGGEAVTEKLVKKLFRVTTNVYNVYGPSETTIWSTCKKMSIDGVISIGKPIDGTDCVILNNIQQPVPNGCIGELYIGGIGMTLGYLGGIGADKFIIYSGKKFYKTGDLVLLNENMDIEYIGRTDFQIKIRGHRVELEEINSIMEQHESVKRAIVTVKQYNDNNILVAYYIGNNDTSIMEFIKTKLPPFMVPNHIILLERFPENSNGKIDMGKLPDLYDENNVFIQSNNNIKPKNAIEQKLHDLFVDIIECGDICVTDDILNIGASSIMYPVFVSHINQTFGININIGKFIQHPTIIECAELVKNELNK